MKKINLILLTFILTVVLLAAEVFIVKSASGYEPETNVVYAKVEIPEDAIVQEEMLEEKKVQISMVHRQSVKSMKDITGRKVKTDIEEGEMLLSSRLYAENEMDDVKVKDKNNRLFSLELKGDQANGWWLMSDQYVDIIFVPNGKAGIHSTQKPENPESVSTMNTGSIGSETENYVQRLRNIRIAALIDDKGKLVKNGERPMLPRYVSFEVTDKQDEFLAYAKGNGRLEISVIPQ